MKQTHKSLYEEQAYSILFTRIVSKQAELTKVCQTPDFIDMIPVSDASLDEWLPESLAVMARKQNAYHAQQSLRFTLCEYQKLLNTLYRLKQLHHAMTSGQEPELSPTEQRVLHWVTFGLNTLSLMIVDSFNLPVQSQRDPQAMGRFRALTWANTLERHLYLDDDFFGMVKATVPKGNPKYDYETFCEPSAVVSHYLKQYMSLFSKNEGVAFLALDPAFLMTLSIEYPEYKWLNCEFLELDNNQDSGFFEWRFRLQKEDEPAVSLAFRLNREFATAHTRKAIPWFDADTHIECHYRSSDFSLDAFEKYAMAHQDILLSRTLIALSVLAELDSSPERADDFRALLTDSDKGVFISLISIEDESARVIQMMMDEGDLDFMDYMNIDWRD